MTDQKQSGLTLIQAELKAPKNQFNSLGKYNYRSCEDILEAVKPLLKKYSCQCYLTDSVEAVLDRVYVSATAIFVDQDGNKTEVKAYAREASVKKGMSDEQVTGSASSYARKYSLNGLYLIDDTKDADTRDNRETGLSDAVKTEIKQLTAVEDLEAYYKQNIGRNNGAKQEFIAALAARKEELAAAARV